MDPALHARLEKIRAAHADVAQTAGSVRHLSLSRS
jgi:hypothetical protein